MRKPSREDIQSERGTVQALVVQNLQATSCVARDDRDGHSRYRASKISVAADELGWYREFSPLSMIGAFSFCTASQFVIFYGG